jgi:cytochrome c oxidase assembly protein subunit 15
MPPNTPPAYDLAPLALLALVGVLLALVPLAWVSWRHRGAGAGARRKALTVLTLFLTFDLVLFGAFTRLSDSGLGCPDWPGCYGSASPIGAHADIRMAEAAMPDGPVTRGKAWIEMIHRYLATGVGVLITVLMIAAWRAHRRREPQAVSPWWPTLTFVWVCLQGAFGALTVTMKLYPAIVTLHLLGGLGLLVLLAAQTQAYLRRPLHLAPGVRRLAWVVAALTVLQVTLGGWVSTNYAVLVCTDFPTCQGQWWPPMDFHHGFAVLRELGVGRDGEALSFAALTAIHVVHRIGAAVLVLAIAALVWALHHSTDAAGPRWALALGVAVTWQVATGLGNVVLGWPLLAALAHTGGAAALLTLLAVMITRARQADTPNP